MTILEFKIRGNQLLDVFIGTIEPSNWLSKLKNCTLSYFIVEVQLVDASQLDTLKAIVESDSQ